MPKFHLDWDNECDFELFGIISHVGSHRLAWELNRIFMWNLAYEREISVLQKASSSNHIVHRYKDEEDGLDVALILNKVPEGVLASEIGSLDYILRIKFGFMGEKEITPMIRKSNLVSLVTSVKIAHAIALEAMFELDIAIHKENS